MENHNLNFKSRRKFLNWAIKAAKVGGVLTFAPSMAYANYFDEITKYDDPYYDFEAYKEKFQENSKKRRVDGAIQSELGEEGRFWMPGEGQSGEDKPLADSIYNAFYGTNDTPIITTPASNLNTNKGFNIRGQAWRNIDDKISLMVKGYNNQLYAVPFCFVTILELKEYYCYGVPKSHAQKKTCTHCRDNYFYQQFYYNGQHTLDSQQRYSAKTTNFYCDGEGMECTKSSSGYHDNLNINIAGTCICDDEKRPTLFEKESKF